MTHFRDLEEVLRHINHTAQLFDVIDSVLYSFRMALPCRVQDAFHLADLSISPLAVHWPAVSSNRPKNAQSAKHDDRLFIDNIDLVADGKNGQGGARGQNGGFGDERGSRQRVDD